jgi:indoleamine 2,3-dioxygenase
MADAPMSNSLAKIVTVAEVFDIHQHTGFMAPDPPLHRLPHHWEAWEILLDSAVENRLQVGDKLGLSEEEITISRRWRETVRAVRTSHQTNTISLILANSHLRYLLLAC